MSKIYSSAKSSQIKIKFVNVSSEYVKRRKHNIVLRLLNFSILKNKINVIVGPSGSGKSTLLKVMLGFQDYGGMIYLDGSDIEDIPLKERRFAYISQNKTLYPHLTVFDNLAFPLKNEHLSLEDIRSRINEVAKLLDIELLLSRKPRQISGGQRQKVAFAKAVINFADTYLLDEPFSELNPDYRKDMYNIINMIKEKYQATFIIVTHNLKDVFSLCDHLIVLEEGQIKLEEDKDILVKRDDILKTYLN